VGYRCAVRATGRRFFSASDHDNGKRARRIGDDTDRAQADHFDMIKWLHPLVLVLALTTAAPLAGAQTGAAVSRETIEAETRFYLELDGPDGDKRPVMIWRAPGAPTDQLLPTIYMPDADMGLYVAAAHLRPLVEAGVVPPFQIIALNPDERHRVYNYQGNRARLRRHERWLVETVLPWAEQNLRASPEHRVLGGFSNGGDFSLYTVQDYPDVFAGVVALSPVYIGDRFPLGEAASGVRFALTAGRREYDGGAARSVGVVRSAALARGAAVRVCLGEWQHEVGDWLEVAPGSVAWAFGFPNAEQAQTQIERESCELAH